MSSETTVSKRWQTAIPAAIRDALDIKIGQKIAWLKLGNLVTLIPVPENPIKAFIGRSKGLTDALIEERKKERARERGKH